MKRLLATLALAFVLVMSAFAAPATAHGDYGRHAAVSPSVEITTFVSVARGGYVDDTTGKWVVFRPYYPVNVRVLCPAGRFAGLRYAPVFGNNLGGYNFTCTGQRQTLTFLGGAMNGVNELGLHRQRPTVDLFLYSGSPTEPGPVTGPVDSDTENIWVFTIRAPA